MYYKKFSDIRSARLADALCIGGCRLARNGRFVLTRSEFNTRQARLMRRSIRQWHKQQRSPAARALALASRRAFIVTYLRPILSR